MPEPTQRRRWHAIGPALVAWSAPARGGRPGRRLAGGAWLAIWLAVWLAAPLGVAAAPPVVLETEARVDAFPTVVLQMAIQDARRQPIAGLSVDQIALIEDGNELQPSRVSMLRESPTPLALMVALDTGVAMEDEGRLEVARDGIKAILNRLRPTDSAALVRFDSSSALAQPFTRDKVVLGQVLDRLEPQGARKLYDGAYLAIAEASRMAANTAVVLVTSGDDLQSQVALGPVKTLAADAGMKLYVVGLGPLVKDEILESLAKGSGGRYYKAPRAADLPAVLRAAYDDFTSRYEIIYSSRALETPPDQRVVTQVTVVAPDGATTAAIAYRMPRGAVVRGAPVPGRAAPLQTVPPKPQAAPLDDSFIVNLGLLSGLGVMLASLGLAIHLRRGAYDRRLRSFASTASPWEANRAPSLLRLTGALLVRMVAAIIIRLLPPHQVRQISRRLLLAGSPYGWRVSHFLAFKGIATLGGFIIGWSVPPNSALMALLFPILGAGAGFILPEIWLNSRVRGRQRQILRALPNALDLLAISVEAGLSLDAAMLEVVNKWRNPLSEEFATILADLKVGKSRREALRGFTHRTDLAEVTTFISALIQADEIGLSIGRTLAVQAEQIRVRQRQRAERLGREASVKMLFPMAFLIFPAIFVVILVPAIPSIVESLRSLGGD